MDSQGLSPAPHIAGEFMIEWYTALFLSQSGKKEGVKSRGYPKIDNPLIVC